MDLRMRPAAPSDYDAFTRLFPALAVPDPVPSLERFTGAIVPDATVVLDARDEVVGLTWTRARGAKFYIVYVITDAAHRRRGVGRALMDAAAARARALGLSRWMLNVKPDNVAARALYEACGMRERFASTSMRMPWAGVAALPPSPAGARVAPIDDDARFEAALGLDAGEIASARAVPGRTVLGIEDAGRVVGFLAFDPAFPGAAPFRVVHPQYARALLEGARPLSPATHDHLFVFVEGDAALEASLAAAGATPALRALRYEGDVPPP